MTTRCGSCGANPPRPRFARSVPPSERGDNGVFAVPLRSGGTARPWAGRGGLSVGRTPLDLALLGRSPLREGGTTGRSLLASGDDWAVPLREGGTTASLLSPCGAGGPPGRGRARGAVRGANPPRPRFARSVPPSERGDNRLPQPKSAARAATAAEAPVRTGSP